MSDKATKIDPFEFDYLKTLEEEGLKLEDLPLDIKRKINGLKPTLAKYNTTGSAAHYKTLQKMDVDISKLILDHVEENLPDEDEEPKDDGKGATSTKPAENTTNQTTPVATTTSTTEPTKATQTTPAATTTVTPAEPEPVEEPGVKEEKEVKAAIDAYKTKHGEEMIPTEEFAKIIGKKPADPFQTVGKIRLKKVYLRPLYKIV